MYSNYQTQPTYEQPAYGNYQPQQQYYQPQVQPLPVDQQPFYQHQPMVGGKTPEELLKEAEELKNKEIRGTTKTVTIKETPVTREEVTVTESEEEEPAEETEPAKPEAPQKRMCMGRRSVGQIILMVLILLMVIVVVILLFTVDLTTNQIADTALLAVIAIFVIVAWALQCECGSTKDAKGGCYEKAGDCGATLY